MSKAFLATDDPEAHGILRERLPHIDFVTLESFDRTKLQSGDEVQIRRPGWDLVFRVLCLGFRV